MSRTNREAALWMPCPGIISEGRFAHSMSDVCWNCAPGWEVIPLCPRAHADGDWHRLTGKGYCRACRNYFEMNVDKEAILAPYREPAGLASVATAE